MCDGLPYVSRDSWHYFKRVRASTILEGWAWSWLDERVRNSTKLFTQPYQFIDCSACSCVLPECEAFARIGNNRTTRHCQGASWPLAIPSSTHSKNRDLWVYRNYPCEKHESVVRGVKPPIRATAITLHYTAYCRQSC